MSTMRSKEEKLEIVERAPQSLGALGQETARKILKGALEDKDFFKTCPPLFVGWELTHACNLQCTHCYNAAGKAQPDELTREEGFNLLQHLADNGTVGMLIGGGEPLLRKEFFEWTAFATDLGMNITVNTNGTLLDRETAKKMKDVGIVNVQISIDGLFDVHNKIRGTPWAFERATEAIWNLFEVEMPVTVITTVMRSNMDNMGDLVDWLKEEYGGKVNQMFCRVKMVGRAMETGEMLTGKEYLNVCHVIAEHYGFTGNWSCIPYPYLIDLKTTHEFIKTIIETPMGAKLYPEKVRERVLQGNENAAEVIMGAVGGNCKAGTYMVNLGPQGNVYACVELPVLAGNIRDKPLIDIWYEAKLFNDLREKKERIGGKCRHCAYKEFCGGGCRADAYNFYGDYLAPDPMCIPPGGWNHE
jgi:radical SAM protein with 4Fe4S-binding SPASM domain